MHDPNEKKFDKLYTPVLIIAVMSMEPMIMLCLPNTNKPRHLPPILLVDIIHVPGLATNLPLLPAAMKHSSVCIPVSQHLTTISNCISRIYVTRCRLMLPSTPHSIKASPTPSYLRRHFLCVQRCSLAWSWRSKIHRRNKNSLCPLWLRESTLSVVATQNDSSRTWR